MVHNGIEYGVMAAYAEGLNIIKHANAGEQTGEVDAETTPLRDPEYYRYDIDLTEVAEVWRRGSVIGSWLLDLTAAALLDSPDLDEFGGRVSDSGEGRWTQHAAIDEGVPSPVLSQRPVRALQPRAARTSSPTSCSRRCASSSAATTRSRRGRRERRTCRSAARRRGCPFPRAARARARGARTRM